MANLICDDIGHTWSNWEYIDKNNCERRCSRIDCGIVEKDRHYLVSREKENGQGIEGEEVCKNCEKILISWAAPKYS